MTSRVANLFSCWWTGGSTRSAAMWKMVHSCGVFERKETTKVLRTVRGCWQRLSLFFYLLERCTRVNRLWVFWSLYSMLDLYICV